MLKEILEYQIIEIGQYVLTPANLIMATVIYILARVGFGLFEKLFLKRLFKVRKVDVGRQFAISQFLKYLVYTIALLLILQSVGIKPTALLAGGAALLVGIGLGLQQTFNDLISGFILLIEATVEVGDVVMVDNLVGTVKKIDLRTTHIETRDDVIKIVPNSKMVNDDVVNWNHNDKSTRFQVGVGVAYSSDVNLVTTLLLQAAKEHPQILKSPEPRVMFKEFGNSSLDFELHFYSHAYLRVEFVKSEIRYRVIELFRLHNVEIPFPQQDLWLRNPERLFAGRELEGE